MKDQDQNVGEAAARAFARLEAKVVVPALLDALKHEDRNVRVRAAFALGEIGPAAKAAVPALRDAMKDKDEFVYRAAAQALFKIGD